LFHVSLGFTVEGFGKVGSILFGKANAGPKRMGLIILEDTTGGVNGTMYALEVAQIGDI